MTFRNNSHGMSMKQCWNHVQCGVWLPFVDVKTGHTVPTISIVSMSNTFYPHIKWAWYMHTHCPYSVYIYRFIVWIVQNGLISVIREKTWEEKNTNPSTHTKNVCVDAWTSRDFKMCVHGCVCVSKWNLAISSFYRIGNSANRKMRQTKKKKTKSSVFLLGWTQ